MKLQIDPFLKAHFLDGGDITGPGTERQPVERMQDGLIFGERFFESVVVRSRLFIESRCDHGGA